MGRRQDIDGRALLVSAALKLFAAEGVDAVSIRAINREAGLGPASVHYHFGTKEALVDTVLHVHGDGVVQEITDRAKNLSSQTGTVTARDLVLMLAEPYLRLIATQDETGLAWVRLVSKLSVWDPDRIVDKASSRLAWQAAAKAYPDVGTPTLHRVMRMCFTLLVGQLAQLAEPGRSKARSAVDLELLVEFLSGGLDSALRAAMDATASA